MSIFEDLTTESEHDLKDRARGAKRLHTLAAYLQNIVKAQRFNMDSWVSVDGTRALKSKEMIRMIKDQSCGTTACACGHAAMIPEFKAAGLSFNIDNYDDNGNIFYHNLEGIDAAAAFFSLTVAEVDYLFMPSSYSDGWAGKSYVAKRIEAQANKMDKELAKIYKNIITELDDIFPLQSHEIQITRKIVGTVNGEPI